MGGRNVQWISYSVQQKGTIVLSGVQIIPHYTFLYCYNVQIAILADTVILELKIWLFIPVRIFIG